MTSSELPAAVDPKRLARGPVQARFQQTERPSLSSIAVKHRRTERIFSSIALLLPPILATAHGVLSAPLRALLAGFTVCRFFHNIRAQLWIKTMMERFTTALTQDVKCGYQDDAKRTRCQHS